MGEIDIRDTKAGSVRIFYPQCREFVAGSDYTMKELNNEHEMIGKEQKT